MRSRWAVTPVTPDGRADVLPTRRLRISDLRVYDDADHVQRLSVDGLSVGGPCPDDAEAVCVALG